MAAIFATWEGREATIYGGMTWSVTRGTVAGAGGKHVGSYWLSPVIKRIGYSCEWGRPWSRAGGRYREQENSHLGWSDHIPHLYTLLDPYNFGPALFHDIPGVRDVEVLCNQIPRRPYRHQQLEGIKSKIPATLKTGIAKRWAILEPGTWHAGQGGRWESSVVPTWSH